jgi:hypothetical protein
MFQPKYKSLDFPINKPMTEPGVAPLHYVYPGRYYTADQQYDRYTVRPYNAQLYKDTFAQRKKDTVKAAEMLEIYTEQQAGPDDEKIDLQAKPAPDEAIERTDYAYMDTRAPQLPSVMDFEAQPGQQGVPQNIPITNDGPPDAQNDLNKPIREGFCPFKDKPKKKDKKCGLCNKKWLKILAILLLILFIILLCIYIRNKT